MTDRVSADLLESRLGFTLLCFAVAAVFPAGAMLLLPLISPNSIVQAWSVRDSLMLSASIGSGPFAFASNTAPSWPGIE